MQNNSTATTYVFFACVVAFVSHILFSKYGFNPTDEGFILHISNSLLHHQVPHADFISIRPVGSAILHIPELFFKDNLFLVSRFIFWLEQISIAILWYLFLERAFEIKISNNTKYAYIILIYIFNIHYFPAMALHTIDAIFCSIVGLYIISSNLKYSYLGFFFIGYAALCKQNFLAFAPLSILLFNQKKYIQTILFACMPILLYILYLYQHNALTDFIEQISAKNNLLEVGIISYFSNYVFIVAFIIYGIIYAIQIHKKYTIALIFIIYISLLCSNHYTGKYSFIIMSVLLIELLLKIITTKKNIKIYLTALSLAWCVSISIGYHTPALVVGACMSVLFMQYHKIIEQNKNTFYLLTLLSILSFIYVRYNNIYREQKAKQLTYNLTNIVDGANGIYTNKNTYLVLKELQQIKKERKNIEVVPDFTACQIYQSNQSIININWANITETTDENITNKLINNILANNRNSIFAIPKYQTAWLHKGFIKQKNEGKNYPIVKFIKEKYILIAETKYFLLYQ
jgi:hypothetical protein